MEGIRMKNKEGFYLDISCPDTDLPRDMVGIRMNIDDFDCPYQLLLEHGFRNVYGNKIVDTPTGKSAVLPLSAIREDTDEGKKLLNSARQILSNLKLDKQELAQVRLYVRV